MAAAGYYRREGVRIDLGNGMWYADNNIKASERQAFVDGFNGVAFAGREYTEKFYRHQQGAILRAKLSAGDYEVSQLETIKGRVVLSLQGSGKL